MKYRVKGTFTMVDKDSSYFYIHRIPIGSCRFETINGTSTKWCDSLIDCLEFLRIDNGADKIQLGSGDWVDFFYKK